MSSVKIQGNASGTGILTIAAPNTNTDRTLTLPDEAGTLVTDANVAPTGIPVCLVYRSGNQTLSTSTFTKVQFDTELYDSHGFFDNTTNFRFQPTIAGYYQLSAYISIAFANTATCEWFGAFSFNGVVDDIRFGNEYLETIDSASTQKSVEGTILHYFNGSSDYVEITTFQSSGGTTNIIGFAGKPRQTRFQAHLVSKA